MNDAGSLSHRLYRALLRAYPPAFRAEYGDEMALTFGDECRARHRRHGAAGVLGQWVETVPDFVASVVDEHAQENSHMAKIDLARGLALAGILGGALWIAFAVIVALRPPGVPGGMYRYTDDVMPLWLTALGLGAAGLMSVYLRPGRDWPVSTRGLLLLGAAGGLWTALSLLVVVDFWVWILGALVQMLSMLLAGLTLLGRSEARRWAALFLLHALIMFTFNIEDWRAWLGVVVGALAIAISALALTSALSRPSEPPVAAG